MREWVGEHMLNEGIVSIKWFFCHKTGLRFTLISNMCKLCGSI